MPPSREEWEKLLKFPLLVPRIHTIMEYVYGLNEAGELNMLNEDFEASDWEEGDAYKLANYLSRAFRECVTKFSNTGWVETRPDKQVLRQSQPVHYKADLLNDSGLVFKQDSKGEHGIGFGIYDKDDKLVGRVWIDSSFDTKYMGFPGTELKPEE